MKRRLFLVGSAVLAIASLVAWIWRPAGPPEPTYRGRSLGSWLDDRRATGRGPVVLTDEAVSAVRAIGPEAIPTLLAWLRAPDDSSIRWNAKVVMERRLRLPLRVPTNNDKHIRAMYGFQALGPAAKSAFPELVAIVLGPPHGEQRPAALNALSEAGADGMRLLAEGLMSPDREVRLRAIGALAILRVAPDEVCLPALEGALHDSDSEVRAKAARAIRLFNKRLKEFAASLTDPDPEVRSAAARLIGGYRARAREFLPALEATARDADPGVRNAAAEAIKQVRGRNSSVTE